MQDFVTCRVEDGIAYITMDDGKVNTMSLTMIEQLNHALDQAEAAKATVVLSGRPGVFSAGFDLTVMKAGGGAAVRMLNGGFTLAARLLAFPYPVVVACTGHALAMGVFLLLAADYRIGIDGAFKIGANEVAIGLNIPHSAAVICRQRLAPSYFNRAVILAEIFNPADALVGGFLDQLTTAEQLADVATHTAQRLGKLNIPAFQASKRRAREPALLDISDALIHDADEFQALLNPGAA